MRYPYRWVFVLVFASLALAACGGSSTSPTPTQPSAQRVVTTPPPTLSQTPGTDELKSAILSAFRSQRKLSSRQRSEVALTNEGTMYHSDIEYVPPDKYHILTDLHTELIIIDQKVYLKDKETWKELQVNVADVVDLDYLSRLEKSIQDIQAVDTELLGGNRMQVYQYKSTARVGETETTIQTKLWVGLQDGLPYKEVIQGEVASLDTSTGKVVGKDAKTTVLFQYDPSIQIVSPVK